MTTERPQVSVLIPVLDAEPHLAAAIESMRAQEVEGGVELIFIDGGSSDGTRPALEHLATEDPRIRVLDNRARRTPQALNIGLRAARGDFVARMDAHTAYPPAYLASGIDRLRRGGADHVSGPQVAEGTGRWSRRVALALSTPLGVGGAGFRSGTDREIEVDSGFTGVWRRALLEQHGGWDEGWPVNQDAELAARIAANGGRLVCLPEMAARYQPRDSLEGLGRQYGRYGQYRVKTAKRHPAGLRRSHLLAPGLAVTAAVALAGHTRPARLARLGLVPYAIAVASTSARVTRRAPLADAAALPLVFGVMHLSWGFGFLAGCARFGVPARALLRLLGGR